MLTKGRYAYVAMLTKGRYAYQRSLCLPKVAMLTEDSKYLVAAS